MWVANYPPELRPAAAFHHGARWVHQFRYSDLEVIYAAHVFIAERLNKMNMIHPPGLGETGWYMECRLCQINESRWLRGLRRVQLADGREVIMSKQCLAAHRVLMGQPYVESQHPVYVPPELLASWREGRCPTVPSPPSGSNFSEPDNGDLRDGPVLFGPYVDPTVGLGAHEGAGRRHEPSLLARQVSRGGVPHDINPDSVIRAFDRVTVPARTPSRQDQTTAGSELCSFGTLKMPEMRKCAFCLHETHNNFENAKCQKKKAGPEGQDHARQGGLYGRLRVDR